MFLKKIIGEVRSIVTIREELIAGSLIFTANNDQCYANYH